jgi:hypothetical protein
MLAEEAGQDGLRPPYSWLPASSFMGDIVNLRTARKRAKRHVAEQKAANNRAAHGRSKSERTQSQSQNDKAHRGLDQHRIETGDRS